MKKTLTNPSFISLLSSYGSFIKVRNYKIGKRDNYQSAVSDFLIWLEVSGISKRREVPMSNPVMEYLRQYLTQERYNLPTGDGALFVNSKAERISGDHLNTMLKKMIEQTGQYELIKSDITLHCLRHSIAFHLAENNAGIEFIRRFLGHAEINTTYLYAIKNKKRKPITTF